MAKMTDLKILGVIIRERREQLEITLDEMKNRTKVGIGYLSDIERGKATNPSLLLLNRVLDELGLSKSAVWKKVEDIQSSKKKRKLPTFSCQQSSALMNS